jgi:hypothetical protein
VIPCRCGHDAAFTLLCAQRQNFVQRTARFERSGVLAILQLQPHLTTQLRAEQRRTRQRRARDVWLDALLRQIDFVQRQFRHIA